MYEKEEERGRGRAGGAGMVFEKRPKILTKVL